MRQPVCFGIVGGYGATGRIVVAELWKSTAGEILVGGRDLVKAKAVAADFAGRVTAAHIDVLDAGSLDRFCNQCSIIVNCAGPVMGLQDRVAQAAFRGRCHYLDLASLSFVKDRMFPHNQELVDLRLSFVVSAGWLPGMTEFLPVYAHTRAQAHLDPIESVSVYFGDSGEWSITAYQDMAWHLHHFGLRSPGYFCKGERVRAPMRGATPQVDLGSPVGRRRFSLFSTPELDALGQRFKDCNVFTYSCLPSLRAALSAALVALLPLPNRWCVWLLRNALRKVRLPVGGFVVVQVVGHSEGRRRALTYRVVYDPHRDSWINGLVIATAARLVSEDEGVRVGVHFLADAVNPITFMRELRKGGVELTEALDT
jgi:hypothetical protein